MLVYRLETAEGAGAYHHLIETAPYLLVRDHPSPEEDGMDPYKWDSRYVFGFKNLDDMYRWFPRRLMMTMHRCDLMLTTYEVPDTYVCLGRTQLAFDCYEATEVDRQPLTELA